VKGGDDRYRRGGDQGIKKNKKELKAFKDSKRRLADFICRGESGT